jgi:hypothetical protein
MFAFVLGALLFLRQPAHAIRAFGIPIMGTNEEVFSSFLTFSRGAPMKLYVVIVAPLSAVQGALPWPLIRLHG